MEHEYTTTSEEETVAVAARTAQMLRGGEVLLLEGELGAGKSVFVRGLARALGISARMVSPTFVLMRVYDVSAHATIKHLVHVDAYRVRDVQELFAAGLGEWLGRDDVVVAIEWGERLAHLALPGKRSIIRIAAADGDARTIAITE